MLRRVRLYLPLVAAMLAGCGPAPVPPRPSPPAPTTAAWYGQTVDELTALNQHARELIRRGKSNEAADVIVQGEALSKRVLSVPQPTLAATVAASDLDDLYGRMLLSNRNYGWARLMFQKNLARWKYWKPQTPQTQEKLKQAEAAISECDRRITEPPSSEK